MHFSNPVTLKCSNFKTLTVGNVVIVLTKLTVGTSIIVYNLLKITNALPALHIGPRGGRKKMSYYGDGYKEQKLKWTVVIFRMI